MTSPCHLLSPAVTFIPLFLHFHGTSLGHQASRMASRLVALVLLAAAAGRPAAAARGPLFESRCPPQGFDALPAGQFDLEQYIAQRWYVQKQARSVEGRGKARGRRLGSVGPQARGRPPAPLPRCAGRGSSMWCPVAFLVCLPSDARGLPAGPQPVLRVCGCVPAAPAGPPPPPLLPPPVAMACISRPADRRPFSLKSDPHPRLSRRV